MAFLCLGSWQSLHVQVGTYPLIDDLPQRVFLGSGYGNVYGQQAKYIESELRAHRGMPYECLPGSWALRILAVETSLQKHAPSADASATIRHERMMATATVLAQPNCVLGSVFLPGTELHWGSWYTLGESEWSIFCLLLRLRNKFIDIFFKSQLEEMSTALQAHLGAWWESCESTLKQGVRMMMSAAEGAADGGKTGMALPLPTLKVLIGNVQALAQSWAADALSAGLDRGSVLAALLVHDRKQGLLEELDRQFLSDTVFVRLPTATAYFGKVQQHIAASSWWNSSNCGRKHGVNMFGAPKRSWGMVSSASVRRCGMSVRLLRTRSHYMSDIIRRRGELHCHQHAISLLWELSGAEGSHKINFVEVGPSLGDCMLIASSFMPEGRLYGLALEGDPMVASVLRESMSINGLDGGRANNSRVDVRVGYVSNHSRRSVTTIRSSWGTGLLASSGEYFRQFGQKEVSFNVRTLDAIWSDAAERIDFLHIKIGGAEPLVLQGANTLLLEKRINCVLIHFWPKESQWYHEYFEKLGYCLCTFAYSPCTNRCKGCFENPAATFAGLQVFDK